MELMQPARKKMIGVSLPCRNEEENIIPLTEKIIEIFETSLPQYDYLIQYIDNDSNDKTRDILRKLCSGNKHVRAIFNAGNFRSSGYHGLLQIDGDCCIMMVSDFQDPPELIPEFVKKWEEGHKVVCGIKTSSKGNKGMWLVRSLYYKLIKKHSNINQIQHFTGFGLYDRSFIELIRSLNDPMPSMRGIVAEYGYQFATVEFEQPRRLHGKSKQNFYSLFDLAMHNITTYTKIGLRFATIGGGIVSLVSLAIGVVYLILKLLNWNSFPAGMIPILIGVFFLGSAQIFFIGLVGEYIMSMNSRLMNRPYVVESERVGFSQGCPPKPDRISPYN